MTWTKTQNLTLDLKMYCTLALQPRPYDLTDRPPAIIVSTCIVPVLFLALPVSGLSAIS